jgi:hypothetical protein
MASRRRPRLPLALAAALAVVLASLAAPLPASAAPPKPTAVAGWKTTTLTFPVNGTWKATYTVSGPALRPVWLQVKKGAAWVTVVKVKTTSAHKASITRKLPAAGTFAYRLLVPAVKGWKALATRARAVKVIRPLPHPAAPVHLSGGFSGKQLLGGGTGTQDAPFYLEWNASSVVFTHTGVDRDFGVDQYAMTSIGSFHWSVATAPGPLGPSGCTYSGGGSITLSSALMLATFHGQGTIDLVPARADSFGRHLVSLYVATVPSHLPWPVLNMTKICPNQVPVVDDIASSLFKQGLQGLMSTSDQFGTLRVTNPYSITGSGWSADPLLDQSARYNSYAFVGSGG